MSKLGRNDPCPCGSGKKYKKCCADQDHQRLVMERSEMGLGMEANDDVMDNFSVVKDPSWYDEEPDETCLSISALEQNLVDEWWTVYKKINTLEEIRSHLDCFLHDHPQLVENLGLEHEVLFELGAEYRRQDRVEEYLLFLFDFRKRFPSAFARSAGYYDIDIIAWLIGQQRTSEIRDHLNYFMEHPVRFVDQLYELIYLLLATDNTDEVIPLITQVGERLIKSNEVIYAEDFVHPLLINTLSPYIKSDFTDKDIYQFIDDLHRTIPYPIDEEENIVDVWTTKMQAITRPYTHWPAVIPAKKTDLRKMYLVATMNFMRYLREVINVSWMSAQYYADLVNEYMMVYLQGKKKTRKHIFFFSKSEMVDLLFEITGQIIHVDCTKLLALLNGIYFFAGYLHKCDNLTAEETRIMQRRCNDIFDEIYPVLKTNYTEALCLSKFPMFRISAA